MKLAEQRAFVRWYDAQPKDPGAAMKRTHRSVSTFVSLAGIFGLDPKDGRGIHGRGEGVALAQGAIER